MIICWSATYMAKPTRGVRISIFRLRRRQVWSGSLTRAWPGDQARPRGSAGMHLRRRTSAINWLDTCTENTATGNHCTIVARSTPDPASTSLGTAVADSIHSHISRYTPRA